MATSSWRLLPVSRENGSVLIAQSLKQLLTCLQILQKEYTQDGRIYWANTVTKESSWEKPEALKSSFERAIAKTKWKQYTANGKTYFVNAVSKETQWDMPEEIVRLKRQVEVEEAKARGEVDDQAPGEDGQTRLIMGGPESKGQDQAVALRTGSRSPVKANNEADEDEKDSQGGFDLEEKDDLAIGPAPVIPPGGFPNLAAAEDAFIWLLKKCKVDETWSWDKVMRTLVMEPLYKSLNTLAEKKTAWQKYTSDLIANREQIRRERMDRFRPYIHRLLTRNTPKVVKPFTSFSTADAVFQNEKYWRDLEHQDERRALFQEYVGDLIKKQQAAERELRDRNITKCEDLVQKTLPITVVTRWKTARDMMEDSELYKSDRQLQKISRLDMLQVFDKHAQHLLKTHEQAVRKSRLDQSRRARKARDAFRALLHQKEQDGQIKATTKWKEFLPLIRDAPEYDAILGMPGSTPLELFQDVVDDIGEAIATSAEKIKTALEKAGRQPPLIDPESTREQFMQMLDDLKLRHLVDEKYLDPTYDLVRSQADRAVRDQRKRAERRRRHLMDDLRYAMKRAYEPGVVNIEAPFGPEAIGFMKPFEEYTELDEQAREEVWDKFCKRQQEKQRDRERDREREREREESDHKRKKRRERSPGHSHAHTSSSKKEDDALDYGDADQVLGETKQAASARSAGRREHEQANESEETRAVKVRSPSLLLGAMSS